MFVVITTRPEDPGLLARLRRRAAGKIITTQRQTFLGNYYYHITVHGEKIPWERISAMTGRAASRLVAPPWLEVPRTRGLGRYSPSIFEGRLTALAAAQALKADPFREGAGRMIALVDEDGLWSWCCKELAPLCSAIRVYTKHPERYEPIARQLMEELGSSIILADSPEELEGCDFGISPAPTGVFKLPIPVITVSHSGIQGRPTVNRLALSLPDDLLQQIPPEIEPEEFLGAAYELGTKKFPLAFTVAQCRIDGRRADISELTATRSPVYR